MEDSSLSKYLDEIGRHQLLSLDEERQLADNIKKGSRRALSKLVEANLRFVVKVASEYRGRGVATEDLISEGNLALTRAATKFDGAHGVRFISYAAPQLRQQMERAVSAANPQTPPRQERNAGSGRPLSVDAPMNGRTNMSLLSVLVNRDAPMADERVYSEAVEQAVELALLSLGERERRVVNAFFGIEQDHETLAEIASDMGIKRERARQIRDRALRRLRKTYRHKLAELSSSGR